MKFETERNRLKKELGSFYDELKKYDCYIAGGAVLSLMSHTEINDFDIYFASKEVLKDFLIHTMRYRYILTRTDKAFTFVVNKKNIQCVYFDYFKTPDDIFNTFDFTVCMGAYRFLDEEFYFHDEFFHHNVQKKLVFNENTSYPIVSLMRVDKYKKKGYHITKSEMLRIVFTIMGKKILTKKELKEQIGGMYGERYDNLLADIPEEGFELSTVITKLSEFQESEAAYKTIGVIGESFNFDEYAYEVLGYKVKYFECNGNFYRINEWENRIKDKFELINKEDIRDSYEKVPMSDVISFPLKVYKYAKYESDTEARSVWNNQFVYRVGQMAKDEDRGIFAVSASEVDDCSYSGGAKCDSTTYCLLELLVLRTEDMNVFNPDALFDDTFSNVFVNRILSIEEMKAMVEKAGKIDKDDGYLRW